LLVCRKRFRICETFVCLSVLLLLILLSIE